LEEAINSKAKKLEKDMIMRQINIDIEKLREEMRRLKRARRRFFKEFEEEDESQQTEVHKIQRILHKIKNLEDIAKKLELRANIK
jgi:hypothetical protein